MKKFIENLLNKKLNNRFIFKFLFAGIVNSIAGYSIGILSFKLFYTLYGIVFVGLVSNIVSILFSYFNYKFFIFKTPFNQFIKEVSKSFLLYGIIFVINIFILYICIEIFKLNIYISQFIVIFFSILLSILGQFLFVFKKN
tara:strand:- start:885 stop:1307 length:423 start_codon:yes stop_codon:yes gene_type:complete